MRHRRIKRSPVYRTSAEALREFAENRRIMNKAVQKAIEENRRFGICPDPSRVPATPPRGTPTPKDCDTNFDA